MTLLEASEHVQRYALESSDRSKDRRRCYLLQLLLRPVYGGGPLPPNVHRNLPRVVNGIPLVPGVATDKVGGAKVFVCQNYSEFYLDVIV